MKLQFSAIETQLLQKIYIAASNLSLETYVIGGFVRDKILNRENKDIDIVCVGDGILLANEVAKVLQLDTKVTIFKTYGTAQLVYNGIELEFVGARKESYSEDSRNPEVAPGTLQDDQNRRDFTINALAIHLDPIQFGTVIDPFDGLLDIEYKIIRTPLQPDITFSDDPLRMMRAIRFAAQLGFYLEQQCFDSIKAQAQRLQIISRERIAVELNKILSSPKPSIGLELLYKTNLLQQILPQLTALAGTEYIDNKGHKDNFYHTLQVVDNIANYTDNVWLRWAALLHDIGKAPTKKYEKGHGWTFHGHEVISGRMVPKIFSALKLPLNEKMEYVKKIVELHHRPISLTKDNITDSAVRRLIFDAGIDIDDLMLMCRADITSKNPSKVKKYLENFDLVVEKMKVVEAQDELRNWQPPISGAVIMETFGLKPSKPVGLIKDAIREAILDGLIPNNFEAAYDYMIKFADELGIQPV